MPTTERDVLGITSTTTTDSDVENLYIVDGGLLGICTKSLEPILREAREVIVDSSKAYSSDAVDCASWCLCLLNGYNSTAWNRRKHLFTVQYQNTRCSDQNLEDIEDLIHDEIHLCKVIIRL